MTTRGKGLLGVALAGFVIAGFLAAFLMSRPEAVTTTVIAPQKTERVLAVVGRVRPRERVDVRPLYAGQVVRLLHDEGDLVAAGAPLAVIKALVEQAQTEAELARVAAAKAR
ncbi:MAG TPA: efflux RND transporter periplasmic adaptor subunit, partial [Phenylobacterium sp.]